MPYSADRPADVDAYINPPGLPPESLIDQVRLSTQPLAYWVVGQPKLGKSSYLSKLDSLLLSRLDPDAAPGQNDVLPVHVSCKDALNFAEFCARVIRLGLDRVSRVSSASPPSLFFTEQHSDSPGEVFLWGKFRQDLAALAGMIPTRSGRIVLLLDDVDDPKGADWICTLCDRLYTIMKRPEDSLPEKGFRGKTLSLVVAARREAEESCLRDLKQVFREEIALAPLPLDRLRELALRATLSEGCVPLLLRITGGHPWLLQHSMERLKNGGQVFFDCEVALKSAPPTIDWGDTFNELFNRVDWLGREILNHLAIEQVGLSVPELAVVTKRQPYMVKRALEESRHLGLVYAVDERYAIADLVREELLRTTGAIAFEKRLRQIRDEAEARRKLPLDTLLPFRVVLPDPPSFCLAEGSRTVFLRTGAQGAEKLERLCRNARRVDTPEHLGDLRKDLLLDFPDSKLLIAEWDDYAMRCKTTTPVFVIRTRDDPEQQWSDLPVEFLDYKTSPLCLKAPVYHEVITVDQPVSYHLSPIEFTANSDRRAVIIVSTAGGEFQGLRYPELQFARTEAQEIVSALAGSKAGLFGGGVTVLADFPLEVPADVERKSVVRHEIDTCLSRKCVDLVHYIGHFKSGMGDGDAGLIIRREGGALDLYPLSSLKQSLGESRPRLVHLNGCRSGQAAKEAPMSGAYACLSAGVRAVIAMRWTVDDQASARFSAAFYKELFEARRPEIALWQARRAVHTQPDLEKTLIWASPIMFAR